ncbi:hypothetical protein PZ897_17385 [Hoeflea sp. YIM 152468]|uniref:hypothetical protein n=1 Tax=Hoeflea sp. YIM 152468 TaxID=3031759 RepID=UPI0023DC3E8D|nr:hypothetical protein [Hoeflea sp. YIM 152468]MDF1609956.1 hypothetical protein [Hoeflea sp. YIM 152468]
MTASHRLANLKKIHAAKEADIIRLASHEKTPTRQKQLIYACLNNMCQISAVLYGELSSEPANYELLDEAAELDRELVRLRSFVGSQISLRLESVA